MEDSVEIIDLRAAEVIHRKAIADAPHLTPTLSAPRWAERGLDRHKRDVFISQGQARP